MKQYALWTALFFSIESSSEEVFQSTKENIKGMGEKRVERLLI